MRLLEYMGSGKQTDKGNENVIPFPNLQVPEGKTQSEQVLRGYMDDFDEKIDSVMPGFEFFGADDPAPFYQGLSANQLHKILSTDFELENEVFTFSAPSDAEAENVEIVQQALFLLSALQELGSVKATQKGNLPRKIVREFFKKFVESEFYSFLPTGEEDCLEIFRLRHLLSAAGVIKKHQSKFSLTKKGEKIFQNKNFGLLYQELFLASVSKWNWGYGDLHPEMEYIQHACIFNLLLINKGAQKLVDISALGSKFVDAFPVLLGFVEESPLGSPEETLISIFQLRFLDRFCVPFGLVKQGGKQNGPFGSGKYKVTKLFIGCFEFKF